MNPIVLQKIDATVHALKYYRLSLLEAEQGFGVLHEWGRIGKAPQERLLPFENRKQAEAYIAKTCQEKQKKGYDLLLGSDIPLSYAQERCSECLQIKRDSGLWLHTSLLQQEPGRCKLIYRDHLSDLFEMDSASLMRFLGDIRRVRNALSNSEFTLTFQAGNHLQCELSWPGDEIFELQLPPPPTAEVGQQMSWLDLLGS